MRFSVIINNYNYGRYLPDCIASAAAQSHPPHEIIVVDDGSSDESRAILEQLRSSHPSLRIHHQTNGGQLSALRAGVRLATGDWCCFLDADDTWTPQHLAGLARVLERESDVGAIYTGHRETSGPSIYRIPWPAGRLGPSIALVAAFQIRIGTLTSAINLRRDLARVAVELDPALDSDWRIRADDCLVFGAALEGCIAYHLPDPTVEYRIHGENAFARRDRTLARYRDRYRLSRLIAFHAARVGVYPSELAANLAREMRLPDNRHPYTRGRYRRAIFRLPCPWWTKLALYAKSWG
jgi:glycosyltransferase involved in cell wall biosynthesis